MHVQHAVCMTTLRPALFQLCEGMHTIGPPCNALSHKSFVTTSPRSVIWACVTAYCHITTLNHSLSSTANNASHTVCARQPGSQLLPSKVLLHCHLAPRTHKRVAGACRLALPQPSKHALHLNITRPVMRSTKLLVKSAAAADTKLPGWHGQVLLVHSPATCRATTTHC
jgi:hypothetical protein